MFARRATTVLQRFALLLLCCFSLAETPANASSNKTTAIVGATVIDGSGGPTLANGTIIITGTHITALGPRAEVAIPAEANVIEAVGQFIVPGFIDTNIHVSPAFGAENASDNLLQDIVVEGAQLFLKHGITTIRDSYGLFIPLVKAREEIRRGDVVGPRLLVAGNVVGWGGPHSDTAADVPYPATLGQMAMNDFATLGVGESLLDMTVDQVRLAVNRYLDLGPDFIKYGGTKHSTSVPLMVFAPRVQQAIVQEAHSRGVPVETHATSPEALRVAVLAGIDLIQHPEVHNTEIPNELVDLIVSRNVICSILANKGTGKGWAEYVESQRELKEAAELEAAAVKAVVDLPYESLNSKQRTERLRATLRGGFPVDFPWYEKTESELRIEKSRRALEFQRVNAQKLIESGCLVTVSSDSSVSSGPPGPLGTQEPGLGTLSAIEGLVDLGMTPMQALVAATKNGAIAARGLEDYGTLEVGKYADLLILDDDPLADIKNIRKLRLVMKEGAIIDVSSLPAKCVWRCETTQGPDHHAPR